MKRTILDGTYKPLSRKIFIYVNKNELKKPEVKAFVDYYLTEGKDLIVRPVMSTFPMLIIRKVLIQSRNRPHNTPGTTRVHSSRL